ncbi:hypothetical protein Cri9333_4299 [Crinalium epipsammum PCC 9333]|uniref:Microcin J25-processing protein McjB C-terminal domain-containing protein n=1 Tax=Crinalium epipsammum PCC 9333 TaxID=1173022 RepID=K9W6L7_9CYAN|nr:lasso peptide biosynthesis B2 protein [Crinalium epipsammum]AFZ15085.1 hypothetical protein Cri9333_4299 [Crinalium epipsammum PCC 9333]
MKRLRKFLSLSSSDRNLLIQTAVLLSGIRLGLRFLSFPTLRRILDKISKTALNSTQTYEFTLNRVVWAVDIVSKYMPGGVKCLARALATQVLLARRGYLVELQIGVAKNEAGQLEAHAWIESQDKVVIGNLKDLGRFTRLATLEGQRP